MTTLLIWCSWDAVTSNFPVSAITTILIAQEYCIVGRAMQISWRYYSVLLPTASYIDKKHWKCENKLCTITQNTANVILKKRCGWPISTYLDILYLSKMSFFLPFVMALCSFNFFISCSTVKDAVLLSSMASWSFWSVSKTFKIAFSTLSLQ